MKTLSYAVRWGTGLRVPKTTPFARGIACAVHGREAGRVETLRPASNPKPRAIAPSGVRCCATGPATQRQIAHRRRLRRAAAVKEARCEYGTCGVPDFAQHHRTMSSPGKPQFEAANACEQACDLHCWPRHYRRGL